MQALYPATSGEPPLWQCTLPASHPPNRECSQSLRLGVYSRTKYGFTADCSLRSIGNLTDMECNAGESDGLWTGIMALGEVLRYGLRKDQASAALAKKRMAAMEVQCQPPNSNWAACSSCSLVPCLCVGLLCSTSTR